MNKGEWETCGGKGTNFGQLESAYVGLPTAANAKREVSITVNGIARSISPE